MKKAILGDLVTFRTGKLNSNAAVANGQYPFFTCSQETYRIDSYSFNNECVLLAGNNAAGVYPLKYYKGKFDAYQRTYVIETVDDTKLLTRFLYYLLRPQLERLQTLSTGAATKFLTLSILKSIEVSLPEIDTQQGIVSILSAYDDLMENNTRRIAILEEMARRIYEEWFVRFRFPGHEQVKMAESELGVIPEGWQVVSFTDVFDVRYGKTLPTKHLILDGQYPVYGGGGVIGRYHEYVVSAPTCLITSRGNGSGTVWRTSERAFVTNNSFTVVPKGKFEGAGHAFAQLFASHSPVKSVLGGAAQPQLTIDGLASLKVLVCTSELCLRFDALIGPLFDLANKLHKKNSTLRAMRDLLLPKLISGEVDVSNLPKPEEFIAA